MMAPSHQMAAYLAYWNVARSPFLTAPDPKDLFLPERLVSSLNRLVTFCSQDQQLSLITGEAGTGKTTLLRWLNAHLPVASHELLLTAVVQRELAPGWLTPRLAEFLGVDLGRTTAAGHLDLATLMRLTAQRLDELISEGRKLVVAIDAAHLLSSPAAFDEIFGLLNLGALAGSCLAFVLCGSPRLEDTLRDHPELAARLSYHLRLRRFDTGESHAYVRHRLALARVEADFDAEALDFLHVRTRGVAASLDTHAEACLVEAHAAQTRHITSSLAREAARGIGLGEAVDPFLSPPPYPILEPGDAPVNTKSPRPPLPQRAPASTKAASDQLATPTPSASLSASQQPSITLASLLKPEDKP